MSSSSADLRRPKGSDATRAAGDAVDQKISRLPIRSGRLPTDDGGPAFARQPSDSAASADRPREVHRIAAAAGRTPGDEPQAVPASSTAAPAGRAGTGVGQVLLWLALLFLLPALLAATAAYVAANYLDEVRAGRSEIMFHLSELTGEAAGRFLATQPVVVRSYPVVEPVARAEAMPVDDLLENLDATMLHNSALMRIEYQDTDSDRVLRVLQAVTVAYLGLLRDIAMIEGASHRILSAPYLLEDPVGPKPIRAAAIAAVVGLAVAFAGLVILAQLRRPGRA